MSHTSTSFHLFLGVTIYSTIFQQEQFIFILPVFTRQNTLEKKLGEMLIEQIIKFEVRGPGPLAIHVLLQLVIFMTKQKSLTEKFLSRSIFTAKILLEESEAMYLTSTYVGQIISTILPQNARF